MTDNKHQIRNSTAGFLTFTAEGATNSINTNPTQNYFAEF